MGRGRGKGKKSTAVTSHEDLENVSEEPLPASRRGRLQNSLKEDNDKDDNAQDDELTEDLKDSVPSKELKDSMMKKGKKRKRYSQVKENPDSISEANGDDLKSKVEEATRNNGFRHNGSRRKSKPRRAAEA